MHSGHREIPEAQGDGAARAATWDDVYRAVTVRDLYDTENPPRFLSQFEQRMLRPFHAGGHTRGHAHGLALRLLFDLLGERSRAGGPLRVLDVGSGLGDLTVYTALKHPGVDVIGIDASVEAKRSGEVLAGSLNVSNCRFLCENIRETSLPDGSIDFVIGFGSFHHFIKERTVPREIKRILKTSGRGVFVDSFHENVLFRLFHDRQEMQRMGDELMTRRAIRRFWGEEFSWEIIPLDWMVMFDKLICYGSKRVLKTSTVTPAHRAFSRLLHALDRRIDKLPRRVTASLAGSVVTVVSPRVRGRARAAGQGRALLPHRALGLVDIEGIRPTRQLSLIVELVEGN